MRDRLITLACALGALFLGGTLFWHGDAPVTREATPPTTIEKGDNGLLGAMFWLQREGVPTVSLRERFDALGHHQELTPDGNLLIVILPAATAYRNDEVVALDRWVRAGNTLLVMAALSDRPGFAQVPVLQDADLQLLTGLTASREAEPLERAAARPAAASGAKSADKRDASSRSAAAFAQELPEPQRRSLVANGSHAYFTGVSKLVAFSDYPPRSSALLIPRDGFALALAHDVDSHAGAFWVRSDGAGTIAVSGAASLFTNRALAAGDNARLLANLVAVALGPRGTVIFDDEHQGLTAAYNPAKFYRDPRLYRTLGAFAVVWLVWVLGGTQLQMPQRTGAASGAPELTRTMGLFLARVLSPAAAARRMFENFFRRVHRDAGPPGAREAATLWDWLANHPRLAEADVRQLQHWYADACADRRVPLARLHNLILSTEGRLAA